MEFKKADSCKIQKSAFSSLAPFFNVLDIGSTLFNCILFYIDGVHTIISMATSYGTDLGISMISLLIILLLTQFVAFPFTIIYGKLSEKFGGKKLIMAGIITYALICCYGYFIKTVLDFGY